MSLRSYNQLLEDRTANEIYFSGSRKQLGPVNTETV